MRIKTISSDLILTAYKKQLLVSNYQGTIINKKLITKKLLL